MKTLIKNEIEFEKMREEPDNNYIQQLLRLLNSEKPMTKEDWVKTGRFVTRDEYLYYHPETKLHHDCTDVVKYAGGFIIQGLKVGGFFCNMDNALTFSNLDLAEAHIWESKIKFII